MPDLRIRCDACGQMWDLTKIGNTYDAPPSYCPSCGRATVRRVKSAFVQLEALCFNGWTRDLVALMYEGWNMTRNASTRRDQPRFVSYMRLVMAGKLPPPFPDDPIDTDTEETPE